MTQNLAALALLSLLLAPRSAQAQGGTLVVLNKDEATLVTVDAASGKVLGRVATRPEVDPGKGGDRAASAA